MVNTSSAAPGSSSAYVWVTDDGLPLIVWMLPSPQLISQVATVSLPGSVEERLRVYVAASFVLASPLIVRVGATFATVAVKLAESDAPLPPSSVTVTVTV